jgi:hypothetical protein
LLFEADEVGRLRSTKEGVGETSGKRPDRSFEGLASIENRSGRRNGFSSFGAGLRVRNFTGGLCLREI